MSRTGSSLGDDLVAEVRSSHEGSGQDASGHHGSGSGNNRSGVRVGQRRVHVVLLLFEVQLGGGGGGQGGLVLLVDGRLDGGLGHQGSCRSQGKGVAQDLALLASVDELRSGHDRGGVEGRVGQGSVHVVLLLLQVDLGGGGGGQGLVVLLEVGGFDCGFGHQGDGRSHGQGVAQDLALLAGSVGVGSGLGGGGRLVKKMKN